MYKLIVCSVYSAAIKCIFLEILIVCKQRFKITKGFGVFTGHTIIRFKENTFLNAKMNK